MKQTPPQPFLIRHLNEINFSQKSQSDKDQAMQNQNFDEMKSRNKTMKLLEPGSQRSLIPHSQPISENVTQITSYRELLELFGVELGQDNMFSHNGRMFKINIQHKGLKIKKTDRTSNPNSYYQTQAVHQSDLTG